MGLSTKKTTSSGTSNQNFNTSTTPTNPTFVTQGIEGLSNKIGDVFGALDPTKLVAGPNPLQTLAANNVSTLQQPAAYNDASSILNRAGSYQPDQVNSASLLDGLEKYMSPYTKDVVDTSLADYDFGAGITRAQDKLAKAGDSTFGGSGGAIQTALSNDAINRGRGSLSAQLRDQGFQTGANLSNEDAARRQQAALANQAAGGAAADRGISAGNALTALGASQDASNRALINQQSTIGGGLRDIQNQQNEAPVNALLQQIAAFTGLPLDLLRGETSSGTSTGTTTGTTSSTGSLLDMLKLGWSPKGGFNFGLGGG